MNFRNTGDRGGRAVFVLLGTAVICGIGGFSSVSSAAVCGAVPQLSPNPNTTGNTIAIGTATCNGTHYTNDGTIVFGGSQAKLRNEKVLSNNGTVGLSINGSVNNGTINNASGATFNTSAWSNYGVINNAGKLVNDFSVLTNHGMVSNASGGVILGNDTAIVNANGGIINNKGTIFYIDNRGLVNNSGTIGGTFSGFRNNGIINNHQGNLGVVTSGPELGWTNTGVINNAGGTFASVANMSNTGTIVNATGGITNIQVRNGFPAAPQFSNTGQFTVQSGATVSGQVVSGSAPGPETLVYNQSAGTTRVDGTMRMGEVNITGGVLQGTGTVVSSVAIDGGTLSPGNSPGKLTIQGDLLFKSGMLNLEFGKFGADMLDITGSASFVSGTIMFSALGGYKPHYGDHWTFLYAGGGISGLENMHFDFSHLGDENEYDYFVTEDGGNLIVNVADADSGGSVAAVPEPETYAMLIAGIGLVGFVYGRRRNRAR